ncbi:hypothetical protein EH346_05855 [Enterococcus faecium]|nr:hypothetical protein [Enterococcus faecium]
MHLIGIMSKDSLCKLKEKFKREKWKYTNTFNLFDLYLESGAIIRFFSDYCPTLFFIYFSLFYLC